MDRMSFGFKGSAILMLLCLLQGCDKHADSSEESELMLSQNMDTPICDQMIELQGPKSAYAVCFKEAQAGNVQAQARLGYLYAEGLLGEENWPQAMTWFLKAAEQNHPQAQYVVAQNYLHGRGTEKNPELGLNWLKKSAESNFPPAQAQLGYMYFKGQGVNQDLELAKSWLIKSVDQDDVNGQCYLGMYYLESNDSSNYTHAQMLLTKAAEKNNPLAMVKLGDYYRKGLSGKNDQAKTQYWYTQAIESKHPIAQYEIAQLIFNKLWQTGVDPIFLLSLSADAGFPPAQLELARRYHQGMGVKSNASLAFKWYLAAAQSSEPEAQYQVGMSYVYGTFNQSKNLDLGVKYIKLASQAGFYPAQYALASLFLEGHAVLEDKQQAIEYLRQAALGGSIDAQVKLAKVLIEFALPQYDKVAFHWLNKASESQNQDALFMLANCYLDGIGTEVNHEKAIQLFSQLSQDNYAQADFKLGQIYYDGKGVLKDDTIAKTHFLHALRGGVDEAKVWVGRLFKDDVDENNNTEEANELIDYMASNGEAKGLYLKGMGILYGKQHFQQDVIQGIGIIEEAANKDYVSAQRELGKIYEQGLFDMGDEQKAYEWYLKAAYNDDVYSQNRLAHLLYTGQGTQRDYIQSYAWAHIASSKGINDASFLKEQLSDVLSTDEKYQATKLSYQFQSKMKKSQLQISEMNETR